MLKLKYSGPKPFINQHGIFFKEGKEDKYIYLKIATRVLLSIDKVYRKQENFQVFIDNHDNLTDADILEILKMYEPNLEQHVQNEEKKYEQHITNMIKEVEENKIISDNEKKIWIKNINLMKDYMIQREINKLYYIHLIKAIKNIIHKDDIKEIDIDFSLEHWHILESIAGNLEYGTNSIPTLIKVEENKNGELVAKLFINR